MLHACAIICKQQALAGLCSCPSRPLTWPRCAQVLDVLCAVAEYDELPVRHNEDKLNMTLSGIVRFPIKECDADDPHAKAKLLLQARPTPWFLLFDQLKADTTRSLGADGLTLPTRPQPLCRHTWAG